MLPVVPGGAGAAIKAFRFADYAANIVEGIYDTIQGVEDGNALKIAGGVLRAATGIGANVKALRFIADSGSAQRLIVQGSDAQKLFKTSDEMVDFVKEGNRLIGTFKDLNKISLKKGTKLEAHHLIEKRLAKAIGIKEGDIISVVLTKEQHQVFTNLWRDAIEYGTDYGKMTKEQVFEKAQKVYKDYPELSKIVADWFTKVVKD